MRDNQSADADPTPDDIRLEQVIAADMSKIFEGQGLGDIALSPLFTPAEHQAVQLTTKAGRDGVLQNTDVPVQLSASIEGRTNSFNSFGMVIVKDGESTDLSSLSGFDELNHRSQILFSNFKQRVRAIGTDCHQSGVFRRRSHHFCHRQQLPIPPLKALTFLI